MHPHLRPLLVALTSSFALQNFAAAALTTPRAIHSKDTMFISNIRASPDGFERPVIAVNGHHPALLIKAKKGDEFELTVANHLTEETMLRQTSIHGIFQHKSSWADGPEGVTQCPVAQFGNSFTYKFNAGNETGTYWYHSHFAPLILSVTAETQYCDGLRGPLVIYDDNDPYRNDYDGGHILICSIISVQPVFPAVDNEDTIITLADWYHLQAPSINTTIAPPVNATLINGKGRQPVKPDSPLAIVNVKQGKRYRFRILSLSCDPNYNFSIDGHDLTVIEADGQLTRKLVVQRLQIPMTRGELLTLLVFSIRSICAGHAFSVIQSAGSPNKNYIDPVRRDVVSIGDPDRKENVTIRFVTDNPGPWFFHCHIEFHLSGGLGAVFVEDQKDIKSSDRAPPPSWSELCPTFDALPTNATFVSTVATPTAPTAPTNIPF
ncbi:bilirubin oxidase [Coprinopsis cinerea okayama7|uniref:Bilirubin oxidase n=1 Tax=Coprinopsis cinerea (strain Okayama-7 / 130 / ATCC MYA-4618 / FGSC 9003) TaxID=240176 RepID=A8N3P1_COPC7|nr:bilirubin oxidase [Coprinopsis cinerea okayama7\|eukprot:XP_001829507.2 bilirubin oxidase [Coprinopsis cinerea okayama7\